MANTYCTATNWGKDFFTHEDRNDFYLSGHPGDVWVVGNNAAGVSWINRVTGTGKTKAEAQAIVDGKIDEAIVAYDALSAEEQAERSKPVKYTLPQEQTMATYKGVKGVKVETKASDPTASEAIGTVWYNTPGDALKYAIQSAGVWASGGTMNTARFELGGCGLQTAGLVFGGGVPYKTVTESYNGSTWTETGDLNTERAGPGGAGTNTAGLAFGGNNPAGVKLDVTETFNGSAWTEVGDLNTARSSASGAGITTAAIVAGGHIAPAYTAFVETWNGSSWTEVADLNAARGFAAMATQGTTTASLFFGGQPGPGVANESYNGTSWTELADLNTGPKTRLGGAGTQTDAVGFGGDGSLAATETWNGTSWTETTNMATGRGDLTGFGTGSLALAAGGRPPTTGATEEWTNPVYTIKTVTVS